MGKIQAPREIFPRSPGSDVSLLPASPPARFRPGHEGMVFAAEYFEAGVFSMLMFSTLTVVMVLFAAPDTEAARSTPTAAAAVRQVKEIHCLNDSCHTDLNRAEFLHEPARRQKCVLCHVPGSQVRTENIPPGSCVTTWKLSRLEEELCTACHPLALKNFAHEPVANGNCLGCHDPHQSRWAHILRKDPGTDLCISCHEKDAFLQHEKIHEPVRAGGCILCHEAHSSWNPQLLVANPPELCHTCHEEQKKASGAYRHVHPPVEQGCSECHDAHASEHPYQLLGMQDLCFKCHQDVEKRISASESVHGAVLSETGCLSCHTGHASLFDNLLNRSPLDNCLDCHNRNIRARDGTLLASTADILAKNPYLHGPVRRADCSACHDPHESPNFRLLRKPYPREFYTPEFELDNYDLCFQCHLPQIVLEERGFRLTRFQDGDRNLHFVHVNREKSRTCRACHHVHASPNADHIRETFEFGKWSDAPVKFERLPDGGRCEPACHDAAEYHRMGPVDGEGGDRK